MRTNKRPAHICQDLHVAFAELGIAWKHCGPYNYKCRATVRSRSRPDKSVVRIQCHLHSCAVVSVCVGLDCGTKFYIVVFMVWH